MSGSKMTGGCMILFALLLLPFASKVGTGGAVVGGYVALAFIAAAGVYGIMSDDE